MKIQQIQRKGIIFFLISCWASWSLAQSQECEAGIYIGKIGNVPVSLSINHVPDPKDKEPRVASMYYRSNMSDVVLKQEPGQADWAEFDGSNKPSGRMTLNCQEKQLNGEWISINGKLRLALSAQRSPDDAYNKRRFATLAPIHIKAETKGGLKFETFDVAWPSATDPKVSGLRLVGSSSGIAKINRLLWDEVLQNTQSLSDCAKQFQQRFGSWEIDGGFGQKFAHAVGAFVVVNSGGGYECGWGRDFDNFSRAYDVISGKPLDFKRWFQPALRELSGDKWQETGLAQIISRFGQIQHNKDNKECFEDAVFSVHDGYPSEDGMVFEGGFFTPSKFCRGSADVTIPYARVAPFLSAEGKRSVKAIDKRLPKSRSHQLLSSVVPSSGGHRIILFIFPIVASSVVVFSLMLHGKND